jgi:hypothetical protein
MTSYSQFISPYSFTHSTPLSPLQIPLLSLWPRILFNMSTSYSRIFHFFLTFITFLHVSNPPSYTHIMISLSPCPYALCVLTQFFHPHCHAHKPLWQPGILSHLSLSTPSISSYYPNPQSTTSPHVDRTYSSKVFKTIGGSDRILRRRLFEPKVLLWNSSPLWPYDNPLNS